jgi:hypothetical protein
MQLFLLLSVLLQFKGAFTAAPFPGEGTVQCGQPLYDNKGKNIGRAKCTNADAIRLGKRPNTWDSTDSKPPGSYAFWDSGRWEHWSCPDRYDRWLTAVTSSTACRQHIPNPAKWGRAHAIKVQKMNNCPAGSFYDLWEGGTYLYIKCQSFQICCQMSIIQHSIRKLNFQ